MNIALAKAVEIFHLAVIVVMVWSLKGVAKPLQSPRLFKFAVALWVLVPLLQGVCGGRCPLSLLSYYLASGNTSGYPSLTRTMLGRDIPWWITMAFGVAVAIAGTASAAMHRAKWLRYERDQAAWQDAQKQSKKPAPRKHRR